MSMWMGFQDLVIWVAVTIRLYSHLAWLWLNRALAEALSPPPRTTRAHHKVLLLGDGLACGVGDWITLGTLAGAQRSLQTMINREPRIRTIWSVVTAGHPTATSLDWRPDCQEKPARFGSVVERTLWKDMMNGKYTNDADIVVIMLGLMDGSRHSRCKAVEETAVNIIDIAQTFRDAGKTVLVCQIPASCPDAKERNSVLRRVVLGRLADEADAAGAEESKGDERSSRAPPTLMLGPNMATGRFTQRSMYCFDGFHFSSEGYKALARTVFDKLLDRMVATEFKPIADMLASGESLEAVGVAEQAQAQREWAASGCRSPVSPMARWLRAAVPVAGSTLIALWLMRARAWQLLGF